MITLQLDKPHWIKDEGDDPSDQCAHGFVEFTIDNEKFVSVEDGEWTVSAAALFLLRTVTANHSPADSLAEENFLIPCCGFNIWPGEETKFPFYILGCNMGVDPTITHRNGNVQVSFKDKTVRVSRRDWAKAVLPFAEQVEKFYQSSAKKDELEDDFEIQGWDFFWSDWAVQKKCVRAIIDA